MSEFYQKSVDSLFLKILGIIVVGVLIAIVGLVFHPNEEGVIANVLLAGTSVFCYFLQKTKYKSLAHHLLVFCFLSLYLYMVITLGMVQYYIYLAFPCGIIYTLIFFKNFKINIGYLILFLGVQFILLYQMMEVSKTGLLGEYLSECIHFIAYDAALFSVGFFFVDNIKRFKIRLNKATRNLEKSQAALDRQELELTKRNLQLKKYNEAGKKQRVFEMIVSEKLSPLGQNADNFLAMLRLTVHSKLSEKELEILDFASKNTEELAELTQGLATYGSLNENDLKFEEFNFSQFFNELKMEKFREIVEHNVYLNWEGEEVKITADKSLFKKLFSLLIDNSINFSMKGRQPRIDITSSEDEQSFFLKIMDNGIGIEPQLREEVFQIYSKIDDENKIGGVGLGLPICKKIIEFHNGAIWLENSPIGGTSVALQIPKVEISK